MSQKDFKSLFITKEFQALAGKGGFNIIMLSVIMCFTYIALGYALGGLDKLQERMKNPFTNWLDLPLSESQKEMGFQLLDEFSNLSVLDSFDLQSVKPYRVLFEVFENFKTGEKYNYKIRSIDPDDPLLAEILKPKNLNASYQLDQQNFESCGIIIKAESLESLNIPDKGITKVPLSSEEHYGINKYYFPITAVVHSLPNNADAFISSHLFRLLWDSNRETGFTNTGTINKLNFSVESEAAFKALSNNKETLEDLIQPYQIEAIKAHNIGFNNRINVQLFLDSISNLETRFMNEKALVQSAKTFDYFTPFNCDIDETLNVTKPSYLAFNFENLENVRALKKHIKNKYGFEVSMDQVEDKENFYIVSLMTTIVASILFLFGLVSVVLYIFNLIKMHLESIKQNLGTLKAFGLENKKVMSYYLNITTKFILICMLIAFVISLIIMVINNYLINFEVPIKLFSVYTLLAFTIIFFISLYSANRIIKTTLSRTPGDLIYNRK